MPPRSVWISTDHLELGWSRMKQNKQTEMPRLQGSGNSGLSVKLSYTIPEVCLATGLGRTSIYEAIAAGSLRSIRACGRRLVRKADLEAWLDSFEPAH
jgi:excisionase family DNA binding protein